MSPVGAEQLVFERARLHLAFGWPTFDAGISVNPRGKPGTLDGFSPEIILFTKYLVSINNAMSSVMKKEWNSPNSLSVDVPGLITKTAPTSP